MVLLLWCGFFDYAFAIEKDKLFIRQLRNGEIEYLLPVGGDLKDGLAMLKSYCEKIGQSLRLVAVPQTAKTRWKKFSVFL